LKRLGNFLQENKKRALDLVQRPYCHLVSSKLLPIQAVADQAELAAAA
jgi:hypothetical protein